MKINPEYCTIIFYYASKVITGIIDEILWLDGMSWLSPSKMY